MVKPCLRNVANDTDRMMAHLEGTTRANYASVFANVARTSKRSIRSGLGPKEEVAHDIIPRVLGQELDSELYPITGCM